MDSNYARLLQQQQLFLQLQILSQQQQHYNYQTILPAPLKSLNDKPSNGNVATNNANNTASVQNTVSRQNSVPFKKAGPLPSNLDDMKVAELKMELKIRGLPVSGTKTDLIERLKPYQDLNNNGVAANTSATVATTAASASTGSGAIEDATTFTAAAFSSSSQNMNIEIASSTNGNTQASLDAMNSPLPMSPTPSEQSNFSTEDTNMTDTFAEIMTMMSPSQFMNASPIKVGINEDSIGATSVSTISMDLDAAEKDRKLQEKEKQIEELKRKLEQEQKLVEVLKMQLEVEKRGQQQPCSNILVNVDQKHFTANIKEENSMSDCQNSTPAILSGHLIGQSTVTTGGQSIIANNAVVIKHEVPNPEHQNIIQQFYVTSQRPPQAVVAQSQALLTTPTAQILLPVSIKTTNAMQLSVVQPQPASTAQPPVLTTTAAALVQAPSSQKPPAAQDKFSTHALNKNQQTRKVCAPTTSNNIFSYPQNPVTTVPPSFNTSGSTTSQQTNKNTAGCSCAKWSINSSRVQFHFPIAAVHCSAFFVQQLQC
ncbi:unnamed protein product [Staurois parvus]|uniref:SAP domain-containing protein n=1 Tax=Staurois parvus TaxID=386267 RepID=A0ABN9GTC0_9NEOB|nr:unnamed protein product [Staurois parvus]